MPLPASGAALPARLIKWPEAALLVALQASVSASVWCAALVLLRGAQRRCALASGRCFIPLRAPVQILEGLIKYRWRTLTAEQREGIRSYLVQKIISVRG